MPSPITFRSGLISDVDAMYALDLLCFEPPFRFDLRSMRSYTDAPNAIVPVAEDEGVLIGFGIVNVTKRKLINSGYVTTLDVHPDYRRRGVARRLMAEAEAVAKQTDVTYLRLHVSAENRSAIFFYEGIGYRRTLKAEDFYGKGLHAWIYLKNLIPRL